MFLTIALLGLLTLAAFKRGGAPERYAASVFSGALAIGLLLKNVRGAATFREFDQAQFLIEVVVLVILTVISLRANRWWPLWVSSFQLLIVATHLAKFVGAKGMAGIYWLMTTAPTYCQYIALLLGLWQHERRRKTLQSFGDWRNE